MCKVIINTVKLYFKNVDKGKFLFTTVAKNLGCEIKRNI